MKKYAASILDGSRFADVVAVLRDGGVVCFPTDTTYGLAVDPRNVAALDRLYGIKGREGAKAILLLVDSIPMARAVSRRNALFERIAAAFWPGPITLVTDAGPDLPERLTAGRGTIGLRWADAPLALRLIGAFGAPVTATSANRSGQPPARSADAAIGQLGDDLDIVIDAGDLGDAAPSTVLDVTVHPPSLIREGPVAFDALMRALAIEPQGRPV